MKGRVIIYTGNGQGKTTSSLGLALRSIAHNKRVVIVQFMKGWKITGEYLMRDKLQNYEIYQFGSPKFIDLNNPTDDDRRRAQQALDFAKRKIVEKPFLMILDEINVALYAKLINIDDVIDLIKGKPEETNLVLTGRYADRRLIELADMVTEMREIKRVSIESIEGIEY